MRDYLYWVLAFFAVVSAQVKLYIDLREKEMTRGRRIAELMYGTMGSALALFIVYEISLYFGLNERHAVIAGALVAYLGGETFRALANKVLGNFADKISR